MGKECIVVGCTNRDTDKQFFRKFHRLPKEETRRQLWLRAINRQDSSTGKYWIPGDDGARVCSDHFIKGKCDDAKSPDYVPSINMGYQTPFRSLDRYHRMLSRSDSGGTKRRLLFQEGQSQSETETSGLDLYQPQAQEADKENSDPDQHETCMMLVEEANMKAKQLSDEIEKLTLEISHHAETKGQLRFHQLSEEEIKFYTGLPSNACYQWLLQFVSDVLPNSKLLKDSDMLLLVLMKIRLNPPQKDLAYRFKISETSLTSYIHEAIPALAKKMRFLVRWPAKEELLEARPQCFMDTFPKCVSIIDCTEVFIAAPAVFDARNATYSSYKHTNTVKFLVSITPSGAVSFVSRAYPGKVSDKVLTNDCGYLDFIKHGDVVLADRGFLIADELNELGAELVIPAFTRGKSQLSARDVEKGRKISNVRIHVERAMERLKNFRILSDRMHSNIVPHADSIMTIAAAIMNLHPSLVT